MLRCNDLSFGLIARDIQVTNAKVNQVLASCNSVSTGSMWVSSAVSEGIEIPRDGTVVTIPFSLNNSAVPSTFVPNSVGVWTIEQSGMYEISSTITVTNTDLIENANVIITAIVNDEKQETSKTFNLQGFSFVPASAGGTQTGTVTVPGILCLPLRQGDQVKLTVFSLFTNAGDPLAVRGPFVTAQGTYSLSHACLRKVA